MQNPISKFIPFIGGEFPRHFNELIDKVSIHENISEEELFEKIKAKEGLRKYFKDKQIKGELTVVISEKIKIEKKFDKEKIKKKIRKYFKTYSLKDTVAIISETENIKKRSIYDLCLQIKNETNS